MQQSQQPSASSLLSGSPPHSGRTSPPVTPSAQVMVSVLSAFYWYKKTFVNQFDKISIFSLNSSSKSLFHISNNINNKSNHSNSNNCNHPNQFNYKRNTKQWNYNLNIGLSKDPLTKIKANRKVSIRVNAVSKEHFEVYRYIFIPDFIFIVRKEWKL